MSPKRNSYASASQNILPVELVQELFFDCVDSIVRDKDVRRNSDLSPSLSPKNRSPSFENAANPVIAIRKGFEHCNESEKRNVLMKFMSNRFVLQSVYDLMF